MVSLWLTGERVYGIVPTQRPLSILLPWLLAKDGSDIIRIQTHNLLKIEWFSAQLYLLFVNNPIQIPNLYLNYWTETPSLRSHDPHFISHSTVFCIISTKNPILTDFPYNTDTPSQVRAYEWLNYGYGWWLKAIITPLNHALRSSQ